MDKVKYPQNAFRDDNWYVREVPLDRCYFAHTDFRNRPVPKDQRFVGFMDNQRQEIESGSFPCSSDIRAPWSGPMPEPLAQERETEKYYILDGQLRVIRHWYHNVPIVGCSYIEGSVMCEARCSPVRNLGHNASPRYQSHFPCNLSNPSTHSKSTVILSFVR